MSIFEAERVLVTGGAGFIGSNLCETLLDRGDEVICVDNFFTGRKNNVTHLLCSDRFEIIRHDVTSPFYAEVDKIYNLACPASPVHYQRHPVQTVRTNVHGAINMLELANRLSVPILQASTSEVYGDPEVDPQPETYWGSVNPIGVRACYDEGKRCAETLFFDYHRQYLLSIKVARIFNTYGPKMHPNDGRVVSSFVVQALRNEPITVYGDGEQSRSFCYIDDLVDGLVRLMQSASDTIGPINLGGTHACTITHLAETIIDLVGSRSSIVHKPIPADDPRQRCPNIEKAIKQLSWQPTTSLNDGLTRTIDYFDALLANQTYEQRCL